MSEDYYGILGVPRNATSKQVRDRFLRLARDRHPDRYSDDEKEQAEIDFQKITQAYNVLLDPERRRLFDQELELKSKAPARDVEAQAARVYIRRGVEAFKKKHYREAAENFEQATREDPGDPQAWHYLARVSSQRASWLSRGLAAATKAAELEPMNPIYLKQAGSMAAQAGLTAKALKYYRDALTFGGEDPEVQAALKALRKSSG